ncbi:MAG: ribosomal protein S18-alanine N-acetyltransferase [candidate division Zixibacteria bacterium]|nr:ribosomal protein S18-alanine N-acetyltransferase [candidate division Zixibacteria bacterium]
MAKIVEDFIIENMKEEDLDEILRIERESFSDPWRKEFFLQDLCKEYALPVVVRIGGRLAGYTCLWKIEDEIQIANIAIAKEYRGRGVAKRLLEWIVEQSLKQNFKYITLDVRESNSVALGLYRKYGFEEIVRRKNYYCNPVEDAIVMEKKL